MKAIVQDHYGTVDDLHLRDVDTPQPKENEVLVRVRGASVHPDIWHAVTGQPYVLRLMGGGFRKPKYPIPGIDLAGVVESVGANAKRFKPGDEVFGEIVGGMQWRHGGAFAEFVAAPEAELYAKPANVTFEQAAAVPTAGVIALRSLRDAGDLQGKRVLINGAAGGVGMFAVQIAKAYGAHVTGVDCTSKLQLMSSLGADAVVDYTQEDVTAPSARYDFILDVASTLSMSDCKRMLTPEGLYVIVGHDHFGEARGRWLGSLPHVFKLMALSPFVSHLPKPNFELDTDNLMQRLKGLVEDGKITPLIDKTFPLSETREALRYLQSGEAHGRVIIIP